MKTKFNLLFLIFISFILMGCPAGSFYRYVLADTAEDQMTYGDIQITYDDATKLHISCGNYVQFMGSKERGLLATVKVVSKEEPKNKYFIDKIVSSNFGELLKTTALSPNKYIVRDTLNTHYYHLSLKDLSQRKINKKVKKDSIFITLKNGDKLVFVKKQGN